MIKLRTCYKWGNSIASHRIFPIGLECNILPAGSGGANTATVWTFPPWLSTSARGWGEPPIDFLAWGHKIFRIQHSTIAKRFYAIRFLHVAEGYDDLSLRGQRVKSIIKGAKRRVGELERRPPSTRTFFGGPTPSSRRRTTPGRTSASHKSGPDCYAPSFSV